MEKNGRLPFTKKEAYGEMIKIFTEMDRQDLIDFVNHEIELLEKKAQKSKSLANSKINEEIKEMVYNELCKLDKPITISELISTSEILSKYRYMDGKIEKMLSSSKVSSIMTKLRAGNLVERTVVGKSTLFKAI